MRLAVLLLFFAACSQSAPATPGPLVDDGTWDGGATDVPLTYHPSLQRFSIPVQVGDAPPFDALVDTGSAGLRIVPGGVPDSALSSITSTSTSANYYGTFKVDGVVALARLTIGDRTTGSPVPVMLIRSVGSDDELRAHFSGFSAILGIGMRATDTTPVVLGNPIAQLPGNPGFIVRAPATGELTGTLHIGPDPADIAAFRTMQLPPLAEHLPDGTPTWNDVLVPGCVSYVQGSPVSMCTTFGLVDTGTPGIILGWRSYLQDPSDVGAGSNVEVAIGENGSLGTVEVPTDRPVLIAPTVKASVGQILGVPPAAGPSSLLFGTTVFFSFDAYFDQRDGIIGLAPR